jgi:Family of unknown function (DUF6318)
MRVGTAPAAWGLACALALTGCSGGDDQAGGPTPSGPPAATTTPTAASPPHDGPPVLPALAREHSNAGAKAFARYYIDVLNHAHEVGGVRQLRSLGTDTCLPCQILIEGIVDTEHRGGSQQGGHWQVQFAGSLPSNGRRDAHVLVRIHVRPGISRRSRNDKPHHIHPQNVAYQFDLRWYDRSWLLDDIGAA